MIINSNEVHVWCCNLNSQHTQDFYPFLSLDERLRSERFIYPEHRNLFISARGILRKILSGYLKMPPKSIQFQYGSHDKPFLKHGPIQFNVSHSSEWALYAFSLDKEVGVDIEAVRPDIYSIDLEKMVLTEREQKEGVHYDEFFRMQRFYSLWCYKEALLKGLGLGLHYALQELDVGLDSHNHAKILSQDLQEWQLYSINSPKDYKAALAVKTNESNLLIKEYPVSL